MNKATATGPEINEKLKPLLSDLPDAEGARRFYERITTEHPRAAKLLARDTGLLADALALAAWSPLLATTLAQNPEHLTWLARERTTTRVRTAEEFGESLARFALTNSQLDPQVLLARFRRRELLRIYLHDIRRICTLVEITEELSNLADAVLAYALQLARQELDNLYGSPLRTDERGRTAAASFCIIALGKLGSRELNYSSDIDLLFLYSDDGITAGAGTRGSITNREYFGKLAERVARIVGQPSGEGAAYRVDLRLRPHGRDGAISCSLAEAVRYYHETAHPWELQALIRSRPAAGAAEIYTRFDEQLRGRIYARSETVARSLTHVRLAKQKIDRHHNQETKGFNVKLGRGGIREIEFIAQALQLAYGGRDPWLHAPHTLISLGRLADRGFITKRERSELSDAYVFLRTLEHRLQMEQGLQTHSVPEDDGRRALVARRMNFMGADALASFDHALHIHTTHVRAAYDRVFGPVEEIVVKEAQNNKFERKESTSLVVDDHARAGQELSVDAETAAAVAAATVFAPRLAGFSRETDATSVEQMALRLREAAHHTLNPRRALTLVARAAASLDKLTSHVELSDASLIALVHLCGNSEYFGEMIASNPALILALRKAEPPTAERDYRESLRAAIDRESSLGGELAALRRAWAKLLVEIGARDVAGEISLSESNHLQTELAAASLNAGYFMARREMARRYRKLDAGPRIAVLGLGRLGSGGMDYGSDLDIVLVYDTDVPSPVAALTQDEAYARLTEILVAALSSVTRDGYLYRVDLRLRPDGKNGPLASGTRAFLEYLQERANVWEWLAYVKLRAVAGDLELGKMIERKARRAIHEAARRVDRETLRAETRRVRERLEHERGKVSRHTTDIKFGAGGMLDVYFATRYLQLRDDVPDEDPNRSTPATLSRLESAGSLGNEDYQALYDGYTLLRSLDHYLRLIVGRSTRLPAVEDHPLLHDLARCLRYPSATALTNAVTSHMTNIRAAYDRITGK